MLVSRIFRSLSSKKSSRIRVIACVEGPSNYIKRLNYSLPAAATSPNATRVRSLRHKCDKLTSPYVEQYIVSTIDGFISAGMVQEAEPLFNVFRRHGHQFEVEVYNKILFAWAAKSNKIRASVLYETMLGDGVERDFQTYAAMLNVCARCEDWDFAKNILEELEMKGYNIKHVLHESKLSYVETRQVLKVLHHYGLMYEAPPMEEFTYPRVVKSFYESWLEDANKELAPSHPPMLKLLFKDQNSLKRNLFRQLNIERQGYENVPSIALLGRDKSFDKTNSKGTLEELRQQWKADLIAVVKDDIEEFHSMMKLIPVLGGTFRGPKQFPFLALLPADVWADILINQVLTPLIEQPDGLPILYICKMVGQAAWCKYSVVRKEQSGVIEKIQVMYEQYIDKLQSPVHSTRPAREIWNGIDRDTMLYGSLASDSPRWTRIVNSQVVNALLERLLEVATIPTNFRDPDGPREPAFEHLVEITPDTDKGVMTAKDNFRQMGFIRAHKNLYRLVKTHYNKDKVEQFPISSFLLPMLVPPRPWTAPDSGGFLLSPSMIVRCPEDTYQHQLLLEQAENLNAVYDSLNYLGAFPWTVNGPILDLAIQVFNDGGDSKLEVPSLFEFKQPQKEDKKLTRREMLHRKKLANESYSLWMDMLYRLSLANHYRNDVFWLPQNMDFRGRVYPMPPHLTHIAMDVGRALLNFAAGYPLGERGLDWLKIHIITLHGAKKKASLEGRLDYANEIIDDIMDSADDPLGGRKWWQSGDSLWQVLACCKEITSAVRSGDPENFVSHIPVHQDGSCNGLQHYAALGRDYLGGEQVNLIPKEKPEDTYFSVAAMVEQFRKKDAEGGHEIAKLLEGKVHRKVVKTTVMTVVYGVTWVGGRLQIEKQIEGQVPDDKLWACSNYLVGKVFASLRETFSNARGIQDWLASSARKVSLAGKPMEWITPLGLPVVQPYHKQVTKQSKTRLQSVAHGISTDFTNPPDTRRQKSGMPPNFVHSLDSTHMMLTALHCQRAGIPFVAVHDSYWTHPCFVDKMNKFCREQFVLLHQEPILQDLADFWEVRFGGLKYKDPVIKEICKCQFTDPFPNIGDLDLTQVLKSTYFFC